MGFVTAQSRIDERQGRVSGPTALIRRGNRPTSAVPVPPTLPYISVFHPHIVLERGEQDRLMTRTRKMLAHFISSQSCDPPTGGIQEFQENGVYGLDQDNALVVIGCQMGPYQGNAILFGAPRDGEGRPTPVRLPVPRPHHKDTGLYGPVLTNPDFDPATGALVTLVMGCVRNDCGTRAEWYWRQAHFILTSMNVQETCGGSAPLGNWPSLYRATLSSVEK
ncbi:DUF1176 domain-containing protein [Komagataeibacter diospyri]|uniref:Uncharacterized protein n=1 Tax=Komagataeibacter diospyri TaxID=1932662 RepID=A0A4P5NN24_9PROT|nr:hypothetical protein MSKU9_0018 [Komagataeibacter diospyri]